MLARKYLNLFILLSFSILFGCLALHYGQDNTWDGRNYHFYNGYAFINQRLTWDFAPAMVQSYLNPVYDVINYVLIKSQSARMVSFFHGLLSGITLFFVFLIAKTIFNNHPRKILWVFFSVLIGATCSDNIALLGLITNDTKSAFLTILSVYFSVKSFERNSSINLLFAGLLIGFATAFKLTAACYGIASFIALVYGLMHKDLNFKALSCFILGGIVGFLLGDGFWMFMLYRLYGSPLFPYYNNIFHSPFAPHNTYSDYLYYPHDYFIFPYLFGLYKTTTVEHLRDMRFAIIYTLLIICAIKSITKFQKPQKQTAPWNFLITWMITGYLLWFFMFTLFRYALPMELLSGIVIVYLLNQVISVEKKQFILLIMICFSLFATTVATRFLRIPFHQKLYDSTPPILPSQSIVFLETTPIAYVIPFFQKDIHFVGAIDIININKLDTLVKNNISNIYTLNLLNQNHKEALVLQSRYGLKIDDRNCQTFKSNIGDQLQLCPTKKG